MSRPPRHRRPLIEALEPRLLFSATADIAVFDDGASDGQYLANAADQVDLVSIYMPSEPLVMDSQTSDIEPQADLPLSENPTITTVVFVDTAVDNYETLVEDIRARVDDGSVAIVYLDCTKDGVAQISDYLANASGLGAIHVISHGVAGSLQLGSAVVNEHNIAQYAGQIAAWKAAMGEDADILLYGCNLAANQSGLNFIRQLSDLTGADVAASNDLTGNSRVDADWVLEEKVGVVETQSLFAANEPMEWQGALADVVYVNIAAANNQATISSTNNVGQSFQYGGGNYTVDQIGIQLLKDPGAALQTITVELRNDWHGAILATASISSAVLTDTFQWVNFNFAETNLTTFTTYWIRISSTGTDGLVKTAYEIGNTFNNGVYLENGNGDAGRELALRIANSDGINAAPTVANTVPNQSVTEGTALNYSFPSNTFNDSDGDNLSYTAKLTNGDPLPAWLQFNQATRTFSGTADDGNVGTISIRVTASDGNGQAVFDDFDLTVNNLAEAPFVVNPIADQVASGFTPFSYQFPAFNEASPVFADPDVGGSVVSYRATLADGSPLPGWLSFDSASRTFSGTPTNGDAGTITIKLYGTDNTGLESVTPDQFNIVISATANDAPVNTVPGAQSTNEDTALVFNLANSNRIQIADADALSASVQVTLSVSNGVLTLGGTAGLSFTTGDGNNDATLVFTGTVANINTALATLTYTPTSNYNGADTLSIVTNDLGNSGTGGAKSDSDTVAITVNAVNDAPVNTVPGAQTGTEDTALVFSAGNGNQIQINDTDAGGSSMQVTLSVTNGTLTLAGTAGLSFTTGDGTADSSLVFSGTRAAINTALATLTFNPTANYNGGAVLSLTTSDLGNTGSGGTLTDTDNVNITINPANDAPTVANAIANQNATEDAAFNFQFAANTFNDIDAGATLVYSAQLAGGGALPSWLSFNAATRTFSGTPLNANVGTVSIDVIASDGNGGTVTDTFDIVVANTNDAPTVANAIPNQNATEDAAFNFQFAANTFADQDAGASLTYSAQLAGGGALPAWLTFNDVTRTFSGTPANGDVGTLSVRVTASDGLGGTVSDTFDIAIANTNDAPTVANAIPNQNATENVLFNFSFAVNTFNDQDTGDSLTYSAQLAGGGALPGWLSFDSATRTFSGTPANGDVGNITIELIASDGSLSVSDFFDIAIGNTDQSPFLVTPIPNQNATEDAAFNFQFDINTFDDPDVGDTLTYAATMADGSALLPWLSFDPVTRTFSGTPANGDVGTISIKVTAADNDGGAVASDTFDIVVANTNDAPTIANAIADQNATEDSAFNFTFAANTFTDQDVGNTLTYSAQLAGGGALPAWLSFDSATRTFSGTPLNAHVGAVSIDVIASDGNGGSVTETFAIVVANTNDAPTVDNVIGDQNATQNVAFNFQFAANTFSDIDGNPLNYSAHLAGGGALPAWLSFDSATRTFSGTPANGDVGTLSIDVTANDGNGGTVTETFDVVVANANDAPTVVTTPTDYNAIEQVAINLHGTGISVADVDGDALTITLTGLHSNSNLAATVGTTGVVIVSGVNTNTLILSGTAAQLNDLFAGNNGSTLTYRLSGNTPVASDTLTISASDGSLSGNDTATINITAVNDGPANTVPGAQATNEDTALVFSAGNGNQIQIADLDAGASDLEVTLSVTNGTLTLAGVAGLTFTTGDGTADSSLVFRGTQTDINAALATLTFNPTANFNGAAVLTITTSDLGNTGTGGTLTDSDNINITINADNDAPTVATPIPNQNATEDA
ncbi:putative Ig domain-containing protein, partial [Cellvibrio sp.]